MKTTIIAFLLSAFFALAGARPISFQELSAGDTIHVKFTSSGCFGVAAYEFEFQREKTFTVKVTEIEYHLKVGNSEARLEPGKRISLGTANLTDAEIAGLDRLFMFYRFKQPGRCTTVDEISATKKSGEAVKATESFTDESCAIFDMSNLTLLPSIAAKLKPTTK